MSYNHSMIWYTGKIVFYLNGSNLILILQMLLVFDFAGIIVNIQLFQTHKILHHQLTIVSVLIDRWETC